MRPLYLGGHRLKATDGATGTWRTAHADTRPAVPRFRVDEHIGHGDAGMGPVSEWFKTIFVRTCRAILGAGLDPEHME